MFCKLTNYTLKGLTPIEIEVEVDLNVGLPAFDIVGLPDSAVKESKDRVRSAIKNSNYQFPVSRITVNLAPASIRKEGSLYDLSIALAILSCNRMVNSNNLTKYLFFGELALDGTLRSSKQLFSIICALTQMEALKDNFFIVPKASMDQMSCLNSTKILYADTLKEVINFLNFKEDNLIYNKPSLQHIKQEKTSYIDFQDIYGQEFAKKALVVAASGHHNVLFIGPPGSGKTMLAKSFPSLFPPLSFEQIISLTQIYSLADLLPTNELMSTRPFRTPHHTATSQALSGGGQNPRPGEISLAHLGILFLDELLEFNKKTLEILRQPLEDRTITISRASHNVTYPADFLLIASTNPCPCGYYPDQFRCTCSLSVVKKYLHKLSGPLLDRIDLHIETQPVDFTAIKEKSPLSTSVMIEQTQVALERQAFRFRDKQNYYNAHMSVNEITEHCNQTPEAEMLLKDWLHSSKSSARSYHKILKVSRTIADLNDSDAITDVHICQAIQYRSLDHDFFV